MVHDKGVDTMTEPQQRLQGLVTKLKQCGCRLTPQRLAILKVLTTSTEHPSATQIHNQILADFPMTSMATIYKTLTALKELGEVLELKFSDDSNRYDGNRPYPHPHLICLRCRRVVDLDVAAVHTLPQEVARCTSYRIVSHRLDFVGICPRCQEA